MVFFFKLIHKPRLHLFCFSIISLFAKIRTGVIVNDYDADKLYTFTDDV